MKKITTILFVLVIASMVLGACTSPAAPTQAPATEAPATEAPAAEAPATEAPAAEEPVAEEPAKTTFGLKPFEERQVLRVGFFTGSPLSYPFLWADKLGYFEELNIEIQYEPFTNGPAMMESNAAWDVGGVGLGGLANGMRGYDMHIYDFTDYELNMALFVRPDSPLVTDAKNPENWRGTTWIYPAGTTAQAILVMALEEVGLGLADINSVNMDVSNALTGFTGGTGDGVVVWNAIAFEAEDRGFIRIGDASTYGFVAPCGYAATAETLEAKRELIEVATAVFPFTVEWVYASPENQAQAAAWYLEDCENEGLLVSESIATRVLEWYRGPTMKEYFEIYSEAAPDAAGKYTKRDLLKGERDIMMGVDFFITQGNYSEEDRNKFLDENLIDPVIANAVKEMLDSQGIAY